MSPGRAMSPFTGKAGVPGATHRHPTRGPGPSLA